MVVDTGRETSAVTQEQATQPWHKNGGERGVSEAQRQAMAMIEERNTGRWRTHRFDARNFALTVLDYLVIEGLEVTVSYRQGFWFLHIEV